MIKLYGNISKGISFENICKLSYDNFVVSDTANFFNGHSYSNPSYGIEVYTSNKDLNDLRTPLRRFIYLKDYDTHTGMIGNTPNEERTICDFLMYPKELGANLYLLDALEGYEEEYGNFDKVYEMMKIFGIPREKLDSWIPYMWSGGNEGADD